MGALVIQYVNVTAELEKKVAELEEAAIHAQLKTSQSMLHYRCQSSRWEPSFINTRY